MIMLRLAFQKATNLRSVYLAATRLNEKQIETSALEVMNRKSSLLPETDIDKIEVTPPVHSKPFEELSETSKDSDFSQFIDHLGPPLRVSFNLAAYVNRSESLQNLVRLGVDLSELDKKKEYAEFILNLDFEKQGKIYIQFLHDHGVHADDLGKILTKNPFLFKESMDDLHVRVNYLKSKKFSDDAIARILTKNPFFLSWETKKVDSRLGFFQKQLSLTGDEVRYLVAKSPRLITFNYKRLLENLFVLKEEMGLQNHERKQVILDKPAIWTMDRNLLIERFDIVHNLMGLSHERIVQYPNLFNTRGFILKQRHLYLVHLNRAQYDPTQPLYVSLQDLVTTPDAEFCRKCAKTSVVEFNEFLKTL